MPTDTLYENLDDFLDDADRAATFKYVQVEGSLLRGWFASKWWIAVYEKEFSDDEEGQKQLNELKAKLQENGFKPIKLRPSPILRGLL